MESNISIINLPTEILLEILSFCMHSNIRFINKLFLKASKLFFKNLFNDIRQAFYSFHPKQMKVKFINNNFDSYLFYILVSPDYTNHIEEILKNPSIEIIPIPTMCTCFIFKDIRVHVFGSEVRFNLKWSSYFY